MIFPLFSFTPAMQLRQSLTGRLTAFWLANLCRLRNFEHTHQEKGTLSRSCRGALSVHPLVLWDALQNLNLSQKYPSSLLAVSYGSHWVLRKWTSLHRLQLAGWPKKIGMCWVYPHIHCHTVAATEIGVVPGRIVDIGGFVSWRDLPLALFVFFGRGRLEKGAPIAAADPKDATSGTSHRTPQFSRGFRVHHWVKK
jgi:hypothetical protein